MNASVVIPTRDRPLALRCCLAAVRAQRDVALDVVVVDDGGTLPEAVAVTAREFGARIVRLEGMGPAAARNAGVAEARADCVLLLDDDCVARAGWAAKLVQATAAGPRLVVAGAVFLPSPASVWLRASERIAVQAEATARFFRTMNLACRTEILLELPFDESFRTAAGEDRDWCVRAERAGVAFARVAGAGVDHRAVLGARAFFDQQVRYGRAVHHLRRRGTHAQMPGSALGRGILAGFGESPSVGLAMVAAQAATTAGYVLEWKAATPR